MMRLKSRISSTFSNNVADGIMGLLNSPTCVVATSIGNGSLLNRTYKASLNASGSIAETGGP